MKKRLFTMFALIALFMTIFAVQATAISNKEYIWNYLKQNGYSEAAIAGIMGNLEAESGYRPNNLENSAERKSGYTDVTFTAAVDDGTITRAEFVKSSEIGVYSNGSYGYGLAQWTYPTRKQKLYDFAKAQGTSIGDLRMQLDFMMKEIQSYSALRNYVKTATDVEEACRKFQKVYEGSADDESRIQNRVNKAKAVYAEFASQCTVTFDANGGSCSIRSKTVTPGAQYGSLPIPTRTGYTFRGWSLTQNSTFVTYVHETTEVATSENHTLYAYWWANEYTVTFDAAGGTIDRTEMTVYFDRAYNYLNDGLPVPQRDGYIFEGWYTSGGDPVTNETLVSIANNHTLYAHWAPDNENCLCTTEYAGCYVYTSESGLPLRIRSGHGVKYEIIGVIPSGAIVRILKANGTWAHVEYDGIVGYASLNYLDRTECDDSIRTVVLPTCTEEGYTTYTCAVCGNSYKDSVVEAKGHSYDSGRVTTAAACEAEGIRTYTCTECGTTRTEKLPATGHSWDNGTVSPAPTCTETGTRTFACSGCSSTRTEEIPAVGHDFTEGVVVIEPTATETGLMTYACRTCRYTESREIPALGLDHTDICPSKDFVDVPGEDNWAHAGIDYALENGLFSGTGPTTFEPNTNMSRAMLVTVLWRYEGKPETGSHSFTDVPEGQWYSQAVAWAASEGVVAGKGDGTFDPAGDVTREQMALILYRYAQRIGLDTSEKADISGYPDASAVADWSREAVCWAVAEGIISGAVKEGQTVLAPQDSASRAVVATIMMRFIENVIN